MKIGALILARRLLAVLFVLSFLLPGAAQASIMIDQFLSAAPNIYGSPSWSGPNVVGSGWTFEEVFLPNGAPQSAIH